LFLKFGLLILSQLVLVSAFAENPAKLRRNVEVEWDRIEGAISYEVQVFRKEDQKKKPLRFKMKEPGWSATIKPGTYLMQIRSVDDRGVAGDWSPASEMTVKLPATIASYPEANSIVTSKEENSQELTFRWEPVPGAVKYKFRARSPSGSWSQEKEISAAAHETSVPVGGFINWEVTAVDDAGDDGDKWDAPLTFELRGPPIKKPVIEKPISKYIKEVKWTAPSFAKNYLYDLQFQNPETRKWEAVEKKTDHVSTSLTLDTSRPSGKYRLQVLAMGDHRPNSPVAKLEFEMMGNFRDPAALENAILRESITKPTNYYVIASYLITQVQYEGRNYDANMKPRFEALGGTGRVGAGYQDPESKWGGFGILDLSGFTIGGDNFQFASLEAHLTRKLELGQGGLLLFGTGLFSKELPVVLGNQTDGLSGIGKVRSLGPHVGFTYWIPVSSRLGLQANARAYYTLLGSAPNGGALQSALSLQYGALGSYRLNKSWMGYAGYAYRADTALFEANSSDAQSFASPGQINEVNLQGHYLNLVLEFSF
jgi:hypothetical protein